MPLDDAERRPISDETCAASQSPNAEARDEQSGHAMQRKVRKPPRVPGHWLFGQIGGWKKRGAYFPGEAANANGGIAAFRLLNRNFVSLSKPAYVRHVMVTARSIYSRGLQHRAASLFLGDSLGTIEGEEWRRRRQTLMPAFRKNALVDPSRATLWAVEDLCRYWETAAAANRPVRVARDTNVAVARANLRKLIGEETSVKDGGVMADTAAEAVKMFHKHTKTLPALLFNRMPKPDRKVRAVRSRIDTFIHGAVDARLAGKSIGKSSFLENVLAETNKLGLSEEQVRYVLSNELSAMIILGYETTAHALTWSLYHLARNPDVAEEFRAEVDRVSIDWSDPNANLCALPFTEAILVESMRRNPSVPGMARVALQDDVLDGYQIRRGTSVLVSIVGTHHYEPVWPDPFRWNPRRIKPNDVRLKDGSWLPFGYGPKLCIAYTMSMCALLIMLATIGQRFRFELVDDAEIEPEIHAATAGPERDFQFRLFPRRQYR